MHSTVAAAGREEEREYLCGCKQQHMVCCFINCQNTIPIKSHENFVIFQKKKNNSALEVGIGIAMAAAAAGEKPQQRGRGSGRATALQQLGVQTKRTGD